MISFPELPVHARLLVKRTPWLYRPAKRLTGRAAEDHLCVRTSDLCIEGYPSSANSFSYAILRLANEKLRIAHHCHSVANLQLAFNYGVPAICLIRDPEDAIASRLARFECGLRDAVLEYIDFYGFALKHMDRLTIVTFDEVTRNTDNFLSRVAQATGLTFAVDDIDLLKQRAVRYITTWTERHDRTETISLPSGSREASKARLRETIHSDPRFRETRSLWEQIARSGTMSTEGSRNLVPNSAEDAPNASGAATSLAGPDD